MLFAPMKEFVLLNCGPYITNISIGKRISYGVVEVRMTVSRVVKTRFNNYQGSVGLQIQSISGQHAMTSFAHIYTYTPVKK